MHVLGMSIFSLFFIMPFFSSPLLLSCYLVICSLVLAVLLASFSHMWYVYIMGLVFTGGMMVMVLYVTNLSTSGKSSYVDYMMVILGVSFLLIPLRFNNPALVTPSWVLFGSGGMEMMMFGLIFLLAGLFVVVSILDKKMGALR